jgi:hypothetical protein
MSLIFYIFAIVFFFFAAVGVTILPNPTSWGLVCLAIGLATQGVPMPSWRK